MDLATSYRQLAAATGYSVSTLHGMCRKGQIPERGPQGWVVADVHAAIEANVDPARRSEGRSAPRSAERSGPNAERIERSGPPPDPAAYRNRTDLGDAFARGAVFGAHLLAYAVPTLAGCEAQAVGATRADALALHRETAGGLTFAMAEVCEAVGLLPEGQDDAGPYAPTAFQGFDPTLG